MTPSPCTSEKGGDAHDQYDREAARRCTRSHRLVLTYNDGADGQIDWGSPGDFDQCVDVASQYMDDEQAKGFCNLRHQDAVGGPPGSEDKGYLAGHGTAPIGQHSDVITESPFYPANKAATPDLLALIDAELERRGVDLTKLA